MTFFLIALPVLLLGAGLAALVQSNRVAFAVSLLSQGVATALVLRAVGPLFAGAAPLEASLGWPLPIERVTLHLDGLSAFFLAWSLPMTLLGTVYAWSYLAPSFEQGRRAGWHFALLALTSVSFVIVYSVQNALVFLLGWETAAVAAWLLVIYDYRNQKIRFAGFNYLVSTHLGLFVLVAAFMLMHSATGSFEFKDFSAFLAKPGPTRSTVWVLLGVSFALKSAFFPFHTWLPRAHSAAPAHVSALMSGVIHKAGLFGFLRFTLLLGRPEEWMGWTVLAFGTLSALFGVLSTATQRDLKRLLGYSSTENVGIVAMGFGSGMLGWTWGRPALAAIGFGAGLLHLFNHALFKCLLFYAAGAVYRATHTVDLERLGGLAKKVPRTAGFFLVGGVAITGLPPLNGFVSELLLYSGLLSGQAPRADQSVLLAAAAAGLAFVGAVSALAVTRAFGITFLGSAREPQLHVGEDAPGTMHWPLALHALAVVAVGVWPQAAMGPVGGALSPFPFPTGGLLEPLTPALWASRALALGVLVVVVWSWRRGRAARRSITWGCGYTAPSPRLQYTGSSFSEHFARLFSAFIPALRREHLPTELLPRQQGHLATHHADPVERRMFEVLGRGEEYVVRTAFWMSETPRFSFSAGLVALLLLGFALLGVVR
ncbi:MAG: proton-conducting transporter membrane subunit [Myxococcota bacterium]